MRHKCHQVEWTKLWKIERSNGWSWQNKNSIIFFPSCFFYCFFSLYTSMSSHCIVSWFFITSSYVCLASQMLLCSICCFISLIDCYCYCFSASDGALLLFFRGVAIFQRENGCLYILACSMHFHRLFGLCVFSLFFFFLVARFLVQRYKFSSRD